MRCDDFRMTLEESVEGVIPESVRGHLEGCAECASWWQEWRRVSAGFRVLAAENIPEPSLGFAGRVLRRLEDAGNSGWIPGDFLERAGRRVVWATLVVTLVMLLALVLPSSGPVRGLGETEYLLSQPQLASVRNDTVIDLDTADIFSLESSSSGVEREKK